MKKNSLITVLAIVFMASVYPLFGQSGVGKLVGRVTDAATKEALIGANVVVMGTQQGAATDADGRYFILNIVPGTYTIQVSYIGYAKQMIQEVRVVANITYELNVDLNSNLTITEVVVRGKKMFEEKATNTVKVLDAGDISRLPVKGVEKLASLQAGVVMAEGSGGADGNAVINVRGGRGGEVLYIVDGVPQNDVFTGMNNSQVSSSAIDQMSFQIGGFEAKYGQAQSGIISVTTKSGDAKYTFFTDLLTSSFTDEYGFNLYTANIGGPIVPGNANHTMFISAERGWNKDSDPSAISVEVPSIGYKSDYKPNMNSSVWRFTGRTYHNLGPVTLRLGANVNTRESHTYVHTYLKNDYEHFPLNKSWNYSYSARISQTINNSSFYNINLGYRQNRTQSGDGVWFDNLDAYGDTSANAPYLTLQGSRVTLDEVQLFFGKGRVSNAYTDTRTNVFSIDADYTNQIGKHLVELGFSLKYNTVRYFGLAPVGIAIDMRPDSTNGYVAKSIEERIALQTPYYFGFDITGKNTSESEAFATYEGKDYSISEKPHHPVLLSGYLQDKYELNDLVLNLGVRFDYFDSQADVIRDEAFPYSKYGDVTKFDKEDFKKKKAETYVSPRIGLAFPVTTTTVFHAQYGKFIQAPDLNNQYTSINALLNLTTDQNFQILTGNLNSEVTTSYEIGFNQVLGENFGSINLTASYKNIKGLVNDETRFFYRSEGGQRLRYYGPSNSDFGTVKQIQFELIMNRLEYFGAKFEYTYGLAEGTGSSTSSSTTAAFRNSNGETPKVIAPLDFDQRHTGVINLDFSVPQDDKQLPWLSGLSANVLFSFNSGRPYTPLLMQNITPGGASNLGETKGYVNSAYMPGSSRIDLKVEKMFFFEGFSVTPYVWIENLLDADNVVNVYRSTGSALSTGYLTTDEGKKKAADMKANRGDDAYEQDYKALERDPGNFGIPRLIKVGIRVNFTGLNF